MTTRPLLSRDFTAVIRCHAFDLAASCLLFDGASMAAGRVWRFPFDDEVYTLGVIERLSFLKLVTVYPAGSDVHPPLSYMLFSLLDGFGLSEAGLRLCSLAMTALALVMLHALALTMFGQGSLVGLIAMAALWWGLGALRTAGRKAMDLAAQGQPPLTLHDVQERLRALAAQRAAGTGMPKHRRNVERKNP